MKKFLSLMVGTLLMGSLMAGCGSNGTNTSSNGAQAESSAAAVSAEAPASVDAPISVISREDGSGTRGAFIELFGIEKKDDSGEKIDHTTDEATITNSTSVMMTSVSEDVNAIGYISLGSLDNTVKAVKIDGVEPTVDNIKNSTYKIARPFNIATKAEVSETAQDFIDYIMSADGQKVIEDNGYIAVSDAAAYSGSKPAGKIVVAGSSSVSPVMEKLKEAYLAVNPNAEIEIQTSDSTTGMSATIDGICDIGMASRELKDSETSAGISGMAIAMDGIAVIVNNDSAVTELTSDDVLKIFTGETVNWSEISTK